MHAAPAGVAGKGARFFHLTIIKKVNPRNPRTTMESTTTSHPPLSSGLSNGGLTTFLTSRISPESSLYPYLNKLTPKTNNIAAALITIIYVKIVMEVGMLIRIKFDMPEISRKFIHICACSYVVFWPLFDVEHWGWRLNATVPVVMSFRLLYKVRANIFLELIFNVWLGIFFFNCLHHSMMNFPLSILRQMMLQKIKCAMTATGRFSERSRRSRRALHVANLLPL